VVRFAQLEESACRRAFGAADGANRRSGAWPDRAPAQEGQKGDRRSRRAHAAAARHEVRIAVKKLRYTIEFLEDLFDADKVAKFVGRLKPLQDDLGYENDVRVANELLADLPNSDDAAAIARATGVVLGWHDRGLADHDRKLRKRVRRFRQERPFW
jgi:triphosphatase